MILTLGWKEFREHRAIWLTMILLTVALGVGMGRLVGGNDPRGAVAMAAVAIIGLAAVYGIVCGAMMLAGEHEAGTMPFLDVFLGQRSLLWIIKFFLGIVLVIAQAAAVAAVLYFLDQMPPTWAPGIVGRGLHGAGGFGGFAPGPPRPILWFAVLPVITLEAYAWGLFGSAFSRRVLAGAAIAAVGVAPVWLFSVFTPPPVFLGFRLVAALIVLIVSHVQFVSSLGHTPLGSVPVLERQPNRRREFLDRWERLSRDDWERAGEYDPEAVPDLPPPLPALVDTGDEERQQTRTVARRIRKRGDPRDAASPTHALFWLTFQQAWAFFLILAGVCLVLGLLLPLRGQIVWPVATLLLGVACGAATFGPEQRDLSYQFLSAQHLPLQSIWRFKVLFWFGVAILAALFLVFGGLLFLFFQTLDRPRHAPFPAAPIGFRFGTLQAQLGFVLFFGVWLVYGFVAGHLFVWLCRKTMLALALSTLAAAGVLGLWLPSLLCGGMGGWQLWAVPALMLLAAFKLVRPWAGGRIKDRRPMALLFAFAALNLGWIAINLAYRAWELPDVGSPMDRIAFRASIPAGQANAGGQKVQEALAEVEGARHNAWLDRLIDAADLPLGVIEPPPADGQSPLLRHLPSSGAMSLRLRDLARQRLTQGNPRAAFDHLNQILFLSRAMRNKAPVEGYLAGIGVEESAFDGLDLLLTQGKPDAEMLKAVLRELDRHAAETPPPLDCLQTECYRSQGMLDNPGTWSFATGPTRIPELWLVNGINLSLDLPWEEERKIRLWRIVWASLFRTMTTPYWDLPATVDEPLATKEATSRILHGWLPAKDGPDASLTVARVASLLDPSWLSDEKLFAPARSLHEAGTRSRWQVGASRLKTALALYQLQEGKTAPNLDALVPKYLPELPIDPFTGGSMGYRISQGEDIPQLGRAQAGQAILWSAGPDRRDDGGRRHGGRWAADHMQWQRCGLDLIAIVSAWK